MAIIFTSDFKLQSFCNWMVFISRLDVTNFTKKEDSVIVTYMTKKGN